MSRGLIPCIFPVSNVNVRVNQHGTFNLSSNVSFNLHSPNTFYLAEDRVINIAGPLNATTSVGITVETSSTNTHHGTNHLAQPLPMNAVISDGIPTGAIVQVSESFSSDRIGAASYVARTVSPALVIAPYTNYFYQNGSNETVSNQYRNSKK